MTEERMTLEALDWVFIVFYFALTLGIGLYYARRARGSISEFFISGRSLPWWIAGTSMVATTFAADTPLAVTGIVGRGGIAGNWLWWALLLSGMLTVFVFARLWRRSEVLTDVEFVELRYSGKSAAFLRGFRAVYLGVMVNCLIMGWVMLAMSRIIEVTLGWPKGTSIAVCLAFAIFYTILSGFWGVVTTDFLQFSIAMLGSIVLAVLAVSDVGGIGALKSRLAETYGSAHTRLNFFPSSGTELMTAFFIYIGLLWWGTWYPAAEPGGGGYVAQRIFASKNERHSLFGALWFNIAHYALRPWPWILVALVALVYWPDLSDPNIGYEIGYPRMMTKLLPVGLRGLVIMSFLAAFMSTIDTHLNWGSSYLVNDLYKRFIKKNVSARHYVYVSMVITGALMGLVALIAYLLPSILVAWELLLLVGAGTGLVYILRWLWWRVNAWTEIVAMAASIVGAAVTWGIFNLHWNRAFLVTLCCSMAAWIVATFVTRPTQKEKLLEFYRKIRPNGFWGPIAKEAPEVRPEGRMRKNLLNWVLGSVMTYCALFGAGKIILADFAVGFALIAVTAVCAVLIYLNLRERGVEAFRG